MEKRERFEIDADNTKFCWKTSNWLSEKISASEEITLEPKKGVKENFLFNISFQYALFTYIPTENMEILSHQYVGYKGEEALFVTRKTDDIKSLIFDTSDEKGVKEVSGE